MEKYLVGSRVDLPPIPPEAECTEYVTAGPVVLGLERRRLDPGVLDRTRTDEQKAYIDANIAAVAGFDDQGLSIHVFDAQTNFEYLRFDMFDNEPHYHYLWPDHVLVIPWDEAAHGEMWDWTLRSIATRLPEMLRYADAPELADRVDMDEVRRAVDELGRRRDAVASPALRAVR
jgi:hypothetical protein